MSALGSLFTEDFMSLMCIDLYETDGLLLFSSKSIIFQTTDLERVIEKAENIFNFYLDFNWECQFIVFKRHHIMQNIVFYYFDNMYNIVFKKKMLIFAPLEKD